MEAYNTKVKCVSFSLCLAIPLSDDHKPNRSDERRRIESAGGVVTWAGMSALICFGFYCLVTTTFCSLVGAILTKNNEMKFLFLT